MKTSPVLIALAVAFAILGSSSVPAGSPPGTLVVAGKNTITLGDVLVGEVWVWAEAKIDGNTVVLSSPQVPKPVAARYAWAGNPLCNLYNKEGLPAAPFRTDDWDAAPAPQATPPPAASPATSAPEVK
jgi:hypothetical protein